MPCLLSSLRSVRSMRVVESCALSTPRQHPFPPGPNQALDQQEQENHHRDKRTRRQPAKSDGKGEQKNGFHIKNQKNDRIKIILGFELDPGIAFGFQTAFIDGVLAWAGLDREAV